MVSVFGKEGYFNLHPRKLAIDLDKREECSTGSSSDWLHSLFLSLIIFLPFSIFARAPPPPISPTTRNGGCLLIPKLALNSVANMVSRSR